MRKLKLVIAYEGTSYVGWQRQAIGSSIQGCLETALGEIDGGAVDAVGAGRTDAGVHALGQVVSVRLRRHIAVDALVRGVNSKLPDDIRLLTAEPTPETFHARFDATAKVYRYQLIRGEMMSPFIRRYGWLHRSPLDVDQMHAAGQVLVGQHDFASFQGAGSTIHTTVRRLFRLSVSRVSAGQLLAETGGSGDMIVIEVRGSGFLRHMVRVIVGTLVEVGLGRWSKADVERALRVGTREAAGPTAPPQGLFLTRVEYG